GPRTVLTVKARCERRRDTALESSAPPDRGTLSAGEGRNESWSYGLRSHGERAIDRSALRGGQLPQTRRRICLGSPWDSQLPQAVALFRRQPGALLAAPLPTDALADC